MRPPVTPKPMLAFSSDLPADHTGKLFGIVYITLTGVIDTIILAFGLWSWVAHLLWWALPAKNLAQVIPEMTGQPQDWIPDTKAYPNIIYLLQWDPKQPLVWVRYNLAQHFFCVNVT
ncbi:hypothetical protein DSO57_1007374 [Entomophthora muscae]|uniref:Uncharacterized protein n=1 Tax=Entomophthora muscae TaxID=34485 RepID=A0ACC2RYR9_9FUNG|nr:hypothetical protein DSO57_1007374 [Entomophthora muscae]